MEPKNHEQIREYRDALALVVQEPCSCRSTRHSIECAVGGEMMRVVLENLSWILGENERDEQLVQHMLRRAESIRERAALLEGQVCGPFTEVPVSARIRSAQPPQIKSINAFSAPLRDGELHVIASVVRIKDDQRMTCITVSVGKRGTEEPFRRATDEECKAVQDGLFSLLQFEEGDCPTPFVRGFQADHVAAAVA